MREGNGQPFETLHQHTIKFIAFIITAVTILRLFVNRVRVITAITYKYIIYSRESR